MFRPLLTLGAGALNASHQHHDDGEKVKVLSTTDIKEKLDGKEAVATVVEVTIEPGRSSVPHFWAEVFSQSSK